MKEGLFSVRWQRADSQGVAMSDCRRCGDGSLYHQCPALLAWFRGSGRGGGVAEGDCADAFETFGQTEVAHELAAFVGGEHLVLTVYPA